MPSDTITINTVGACLRYGYTVHAHCGCGHHGPIDLLAIAVARGEAYPLRKVWANVRCSCGRQPALQLTPECGPSGYPLSKG